MHDFTNKTLTEFIRNQINSDIITGAFKPGQKLSIKLLTQHYNTGSSPIREALSRLVATGMIVSLGQKGFYTPNISLADFKSLATAYQALATHTFNNLSVLESKVALQQLDLLENWPHSKDKSPHLWVSTMQSFYGELALTCSSNYLYNCYLHLVQHIERYQHQIIIFNNTTEINLRPIRERQIMQAIENKDWHQTQELITKAQQKTLDNIKTQLEKMFPPINTSAAAELESNLHQSQSAWQTASC
jgi:GntR family carbon starvation induced transcriptional regulator